MKAPRTIVLRDRKTGGNVELVLPIANDQESGRMLFSERRISVVPQRQSEGPFQATHADPRIDFVFSQDDWHEGALSPYHREGAHRYSISDKVDLRWEGVAALGPKLTAQSTGAMQEYFIENPGAEQGTLTGWTFNDSVDESADTSAPYRGAYGFRLAASTACIGVVMQQNVRNPTALQGRSVTVTVWVRQLAGATAEIFRVNLVDSAGTTHGTDRGVGTSWTQLTVTRTIDPATTFVRIELETTSIVETDDVYAVDEWNMTYTGSTITTTLPGGSVPAAIAYHDGKTWAMFDKVVVYWDATNNIWVPAFASADAAMTDLVSFDRRLYAAGGTSQKYIYRDTTGVWTGSTRTSPDDKAGYWAVSRSGSGSTVLWKTETDTSVANTPTPQNGGGTSWSNPIQVGETTAKITKLHGFADTLIVGKEDGLYEFQQFYPNQSDTVDRSGFKNITATLRVNLNSANFKVGVEWNGWLYLAVRPYGLLRYRPGELQNIGRLFRATRNGELGGVISGLAADPYNLWVVVKETTSDTFRLLAVNEEAPELHVHTIEALTMATVDAMAIAANKGYILGTHQGSGKSYTWNLPTNSVAPWADTTPDIASSGWFETSIYIGGTFDPKAALALDIWCANVDANHTIAVTYGLDGEPATSRTLGTFSGTARIQTAYFENVSTPETNAIGRFIQLRFTLSTNDTVSPKLYGFSLHQVLRPRRIRVWDVLVTTGQAIINEQGRRVPVSWEKVLTDLETLEEQVYPAVMEYDINEDGVIEQTRVHVTVNREKLDPGHDAVSLSIQEALTQD